MFFLAWRCFSPPSGNTGRPLIAARPELAVRHPNEEIFYDREGMAWADPTLEQVWEYNIAITKK